MPRTREQVNDPVVSRDRTLHILRGFGTKVPTSVKGPLGRATRPLRGFEGPLVTVVLAISDDDTTQISVMLDTLRAQSHRNLEILVVRHGRHAQSGKVAARHAAGDWRIRVLRRTFATQAAARNHGLKVANGSYVLFVNGGDDLPESGVEDLVDALEASGSDLAVGRILPPLSLIRSVAAPYEAAHRVEVIGTSLAASPSAVTDLGLGNRLLRTSWLRERALTFEPGPGGVARFALRTYRDGRFDLLRNGVYVPNARKDGVSVGSVVRTLDRLADWNTEQTATADLLDGLGLPAVVEAWRWGILDSAIQPFLDDVELATTEQWESLRREVERILAGAPDDWDARLSAESKVKLWLLRHDRRDELVDFVASRWFENGQFPTEVREGQVHARLPLYDDPEAGIPSECFIVPAEHTPFLGEVRQIRRLGDGFDVELVLGIDFVGFEGPPDVELTLVPADGAAAGEPLRLEHRQGRELSLNNKVTGRRHQDLSWGLVTVHLPAAAFTTAEPGSQWHLRADITVQGVRRGGLVTGADVRAAAVLTGTGYVAPVIHDGWAVGLFRGPSGLGVRVSEAPRVTLLEAEVQERVLSGSLDLGETDGVGVLARSGGRQERGKLTAHLTGRGFSISLPAPGFESQHAIWTIFVVDRDGAEHPIAWPETWPLARPQRRGQLALTRSGEGGLQLTEARDLIVAEEIAIEGDEVRLVGRWHGVVPKHFDLGLEGNGLTIPGLVVSTDGDLVEARFALTHDFWGLGDRPVPGGRYFFTLAAGLRRERRGRVEIGEELMERLLEETFAEHFTFRAIRLGLDAGILLTRPIGIEERGPYQQQRLQEEYAESTLPLDDRLIYLQSYNGASATDSQLALHHEIRRLHPDMRICWGVQDASSWVPEGGERLLINSRDWYQVMATARHLCLNIDLPRWFHAKPGQRVLQTFHGYPAKSMGKRMWLAKGYSPRRIELELARTSGDWSLILTPSPEMDRHYREEYDYNGPIHSKGYPRDDMLVGPEAGEIRRATRRRLGIEDHQKVVLYAPTWRDDLAVNWREAEMVTHLDVEAASSALGPDYVFLLRGHRFNAGKVNRSASSARVIDVTTHPEINHLILAADAAVLDYSSLRFDFSLTGRPMVFLVPDLADYTGGVRGFLYPFTESSPGPHVETGEEVIAWLKDLDAVTRQFASEYEHFHQRFNGYMDGQAAERVTREFLGPA